MSTTPTSDPPRERTGARWSAEQRGAALRAYFSTGSRRQARKQTGVPERTISVWLTDERYAEERRAVHEGLVAAVREGAAARGADLVAATNEAVLVCRQALRKDPDGKTASSLLSSLSRARETEDRIARLDDGSATEIQGRQLSAEERDAYEAWRREREVFRGLTPEELSEMMREGLLASLQSAMDRRDREAMVAALRAIVAEGDLLSYWMRGDLELARRLHALVTTGLRHAESDSRGIGPGGVPLLAGARTEQESA